MVVVAKEVTNGVTVVPAMIVATREVIYTMTAVTIAQDRAEKLVGGTRQRVQLARLLAEPTEGAYRTYPSMTVVIVRFVSISIMVPIVATLIT
jgi:hypothetical protein